MRIEDRIRRWRRQPLNEDSETAAGLLAEAEEELRRLRRAVSRAAPRYTITEAGLEALRQARGG